MSDERDIAFRKAVAEALDVPDGGQYLNDVLTRIEAILSDRDSLRTELERANYFIENMGDLFVGKPEADALRAERDSLRAALEGLVDAVDGNPYRGFATSAWLADANEKARQALTSSEKESE